MNPSPGDAESTTFQRGRCCHSPRSERDESRRLQEKIKPAITDRSVLKMGGEIKTLQSGPMIQIKSQQIKQKPSHQNQ